MNRLVGVAEEGRDVLKKRASHDVSLVQLSVPNVMASVIPRTK